MTVFFLKKLVGVLIMPVSIVLFLLLLSIVSAKYYPKFSRGCLLSSFIILFVSSSPFFSGSFIEPIENQYKTFNKQEKTLDYIVVLGCGHTTNEDLPVISQLKTCSLQRLIEGYRIFQLHPEAMLVTSGYASNDIESNAIKVKRAAISLGIPSNKIIAKTLAKDTEEEAEIISPLLINKRFALVTNASHMPRAIKYFQNHNTRPIPAPTGFMYKGRNAIFIENLPSSSSLQRTSIAWYETLGQFVQWFKS